MSLLVGAVEIRNSHSSYRRLRLATAGNTGKKLRLGGAVELLKLLPPVQGTGWRWQQPSLGPRRPHPRQGPIAAESRGGEGDGPAGVARLRGRGDCMPPGLHQLPCGQDTLSLCVLYCRIAACWRPVSWTKANHVLTPQTCRVLRIVRRRVQFAAVTGFLAVILTLLRARPCFEDRQLVA